MDPGHKARKNPSDNADLGFQAVGPALRIMQFNVEGLSAAKRHIIQSLAEIHHIDVICLQKTHVNDDKSDRLTISGFDIISYTLHAKHGRATYVRSDVSDAAHVSSSQCCDVIRVGGYHIANIYKPPTEHWNNTNLPPVLPHPAVLVGDFNSHHPDWGYQEADLIGERGVLSRVGIDNGTTRGHNWKLMKKHNCCDLRHHFFSQRVVNRWNSLSQEEVNASSVNSFKNHLERRRRRKMDFFMD